MAGFISGSLPRLSKPTPRRTPPTCKLGRFVHGMVKLDRTRDRDIARIALPALGTLMVEPLMSAVDIAFVGRLGVLSLSGVGLANVLLRGVFGLFNFLAASTTPLVSAAAGEKRSGEVSRIVVESTLVAAMMGTLIAAVLLFVAPNACVLLAGKGAAEVLPQAVAYMRWRAIAAPFLLTGFVLSGALRGLQDTVTPLWAALFSNAANLILDYLLMFVLHWGVAGAAVATSFAQVVNSAFMLLALQRKQAISVKDLRRLPSRKSLEELAFGAVLSIRTLSILATFTFSSRIAAMQGAVVLAAYEVARQIWIFQAFVLDALAVAAQSLVSLQLAKGRVEEARTYSTRLLQLGLWSGAILGVAIFNASDFLPRLFIDNAQTLPLASQLLRFYAPLQPICALVFVYDGIFIAARDFDYTARSIFFAGLASWIAMAYLGNQASLGIGAVWAGINVLMVGRAVALGARYLSSRGPIPPTSRET
eukprot:CAMPEP_0198732026 /NCGR_PEP_ID=MMETSP1475-20131203/33354_1 /TAXON_ID= ORGANISM="Unidentified sp., Strain CCMP1999" /NCGR_SAMPLE_ID=MMETSP1475 /ASSEMBLY_ACC=CAM_ASM_001111 /LENGTH=476 /DNA_ID=CAMNT_0044495059 /DNA_START=56 /DNA_END=1482 /DNA_ORIENTATION=-